MIFRSMDASALRAPLRPGDAPAIWCKTGLIHFIICMPNTYGETA